METPVWDQTLTHAHKKMKFLDVLKDAASKVPLQIESAIDDDSIEYHVRSALSVSPSILDKHLPALFAGPRATSNLIYDETNEHGYKPGAWSPDENAMFLGGAIADLGGLVPSEGIIFITPPSGDGPAVVTMFIPDTPMAAMEYDLFDPSQGPTAIAGLIMGNREEAEYEHNRRTRDAAQILKDQGLKLFPKHLLGGQYYLKRKGILPFLRLRLPVNEDEKNLIRRAPSKCCFKFDEKAEAADLPHSARCVFQTVFQHQQNFRKDTGTRITPTPFMAKLCEYFFKQIKSGKNEFLSPIEYENFKSHLEQIKKLELEHRPSSKTTLRGQRHDLSVLGTITHSAAQSINLGTSNRFVGALKFLFSEHDAEFFSNLLEESKETSLHADLRVIGRHLHEDELIIVSDMTDDGIVEKTTCYGGDTTGMQVSLDCVARLVQLPWVAHIVCGGGLLSRRLSNNNMPKLLTLNTTKKVESNPGSLLLNISRLDFEKLLEKMTRVEDAVLEKRKTREEEDGEKETFYDNAPPSGIAALKLARAKMRKIDKAYREKLESLLKGETEAQG